MGERPKTRTQQASERLMIGSSHCSESPLGKYLRLISVGFKLARSSNRPLSAFLVHLVTGAEAHLYAGNNQSMNRENWRF